MRTARRGHRVRPATTWAAAVGALAVHGVLLGTTHALGVSIVGETGFTSTTKDKDKLAVMPELKPSCSGDAFLALAGRTSMCLAPWESDPDACMNVAQTTLWLELSSCQARDDKNIAQVAMLDQKQAEKVKPIDPEPLLDDDQAAAEARSAQAAAASAAAAATAAAASARRPRSPSRCRSSRRRSRPTRSSPRTRASCPSTTRASRSRRSRAARCRSRWSRSPSRPSSSRPSSRRKRRSRSRSPIGRAGRTQGAGCCRARCRCETPARRRPRRSSRSRRRVARSSGATGPLALDGYMAKRGDGAIEQQRQRAQRAAARPERRRRRPARRAEPQADARRCSSARSAAATSITSRTSTTATRPRSTPKRWVYASFFNRLKRQVAQNWDPADGVAAQRSERQGLRLQDARHRGARQPRRRRAS